MATVDLTTRKVDQVWGAHWYRLHSPEMLPNGNILVFDNTGRLHPKSEARVLEFNPVNHGIEWQYPNAPGQSLFSTYRGRVQHLDNGNVLISEFENGRLLEVTRAGETVWEYSCPFVSTENPDYVCNFIGGYRYPTDAFSFPFNQPNENQPNEGARPHTVPVASAGG
jgi:outer membrane protein assembly factor BamB